MAVAGNVDLQPDMVDQSGCVIVHHILQAVHQAAFDLAVFSKAGAHHWQPDTAAQTLFGPVQGHDRIGPFVITVAEIGEDRVRQNFLIQLNFRFLPAEIDIIPDNTAARMGPGDQRRLVVFLHHLQAGDRQQLKIQII